MKKILVVHIIRTIAINENIVNSIVTEINCTFDDEVHIKHAIESTRNPNVLTAILIQEMSKDEICKIKPFLDQLREYISKADSIEVGFIPLGNCQKKCETCSLRKFHENFKQLIIAEKLKSSVFQN